MLLSRASFMLYNENQDKFTDTPELGSKLPNEGYITTL